MATEEEEVWVLCLNDMRSGHSEHLQVVCWANDKTELKGLVERETVEHYADGEEGSAPNSFDHKWHKTFRKDGPLEWCNRPSDYDEDRHYRKMARESLSYPCVKDFPILVEAECETPAP